MKHLLRAIAALSIMAVALPAMATHLVGGNIGYIYQGETAPGSQLYRYTVYLEFYLNCGDDSNWESIQEVLNSTASGSFPLGIYAQNPLQPNADKTLVQTVPMFLASSEFINPGLPDGCTVGEGLCTEKGYLVGEAILPLSFSGYHMYFHMFSRNITIDNIFDPNQTGIGYYAFIPPTLVNNSSPIWLGIPTPFLCINDTTTFNNSASDPDGDQLIFSFETPYNSLTNQGGVPAPPNPLQWPIPEVPWNPGFSTAQPFGPGGYSFINGATGLTSYLPPQQGNYVVAVEVKEFRNGQLIGITRRDLQLQAIVCPGNETPAVVGQLPLSYTVQAGEELCFNMNFTDIDADSIEVTQAGTIFDPLLYNPPAQFSVVPLGASNSSAEFCWPTACEQGQDQPYLFSVSVTDNGCPPKTLDVVFQVNVVPFDGPTAITGPQQVCTGQTGSVYTTPALADAIFTWTVTGGAITNGQGTNSVTVDWGASGSGTVAVSAVNDLGCASGTTTLAVSIAPLPAVNAGADDTICPGDSIQLGGAPTGPVGSSFTWTPGGTLNNATLPNPLAIPTGTTDYVVQVGNSGCFARDTVRITVSQPSAEAGNDVAICINDTTQLVATGSGDALWSPSAGLSAVDVTSPLAFPLVSTTYAVTFTDAAGCAASDSVRVTVNALPTVNAGADTSACVNETLVLGGTPTGPTGSSYTWGPSQGLNNDTLANPTATITVNQTWTVTVTDVNGCVASDEILISALAIPSVDAGQDTSICSGSSVQLNGSGTGTPQWSPIFGLSDPNIFDPIANPEATQVYTLTITGGNLCSNTDQTTLTVNVLPNANAGPDLAVCIGDSVQIQAVGPGDYNWTPPATLSDPNVADPWARPTVTTTYTMTLSDDNACSDTDSMVVSVSTPANAGVGTSITVCSSSGAVDLFSLLTGNPQSGGSWTGPSAQAGDGTYTPGTSEPGAWTYTVASPAPCAPATAEVVVIENVEAEAGDDATLAVCSTNGVIDLFDALGGNPQFDGVWTDANNQTVPDSFDPATGLSQAFTYTVTALAPCGTDQASVTINITVAQDPGGDASVTTCTSAAPFNMTDSLSGAPAGNGTWTDPSSAAHGAVFDPAVDASGDWTYLIAGNGGCPDTSATLSIILTSPDVSIIGDNTICLGDTTQLTSNGGQNVSWTWSPATDLNDPSLQAPFFWPTSTTTYTVFVTDQAGCTGTGDVILAVNELPSADAGADASVCTGAGTTIGGAPTGPGGSNFLWTPAQGLDNATNANPAALPTGTTTYTVLVTDPNQCQNTDSMVVTVNELPVVNAGADTSFCAGASVQLQASGTGTFSWSPATGLSATDIADPIASPADAQTYTVTLTDANDCQNSDDVVVSVNSLPSADAGEDQYLCPGFEVGLTGNGTGNPVWSPAAELDNAAVFDPQASPVTTTTFTLTVTDGNGCTASDAVQVLVSTDPPVDAGPDQSICAGDQVVIGGNPTSIAGSTVIWSPATGLSDVSAFNPTAGPVETTSYTVTVLNDTCTSTDVVVVSLQGIAEAAFTVRLEPGCDGLRAFFTDQSMNAQQWSWSFGDGGTSTEQNPQHFFAYGGPITITLTIADGFGCTASITQSYPVSSFDDMVDYELPNVFTPNDDGKNDVFTFNTNGVLGPCVSMQVFNRWGQKVFDSLGNNIVWDGRNFAGEQCIPGTYFYTITLQEMSFNGNVYLNR